MAELRPSATGSLASRPFAQVLIQAADDQLTGTIVLEVRGGQRSAIYFLAGAPAKVKTGAGVHFLGEVLLASSRIDIPTHSQALELVTQTGRLYGRVLVELGALSEEEIEEALREQLARKVEWLFELSSESVYGIYPDVNLLERWGAAPTPVPVLPLLWRAARASQASGPVEAVLAKLGDRVLKLHPAAQVTRFRLDARERALIDVLRARPMAAPVLIKTGLLEESIAKRLIYTLVLARQLDFGRVDQLPVGAPAGTAARLAEVARREARRAEDPASASAASQHVTPDPPPPAGAADTARASRPDLTAEAADRPPGARERTITGSGVGGRKRTLTGERQVEPAGGAPNGSGQLESLRQELSSRAGDLDNLDHYLLLGVDRQAPPAVIQGAFFALAKKWHPDRLPRELEDLRQLATRGFARLSEAHSTLCDSERRKQYDALLARGGAKGEQEEVARVLRAAAAHQRAEVLLKKNNLSGAEKEAQVAYESDPDNSDHVALYVWLQAQRPERTGSGRYDDLIMMLNEAIKRDANNVRARFYRGQLLKRAGQLNRAMKDFRFVVEKDPKNVDAAREIRLFELRRNERPSEDRPSSTGPEAPRNAGDSPPGGLLRKLFKR